MGKKEHTHFLVQGEVSCFAWVKRRSWLGSDQAVTVLAPLDIERGWRLADDLGLLEGYTQFLIVKACLRQLPRGSRPGGFSRWGALRVLERYKKRETFL